METLANNFQFKQTCREIVSKYYNDQLEAYDVFIDDLLKRLQSNPQFQPSDGSAEGGEFEFGVSREEILAVIHIILASYHLWHELSKTHKNEKMLTLKEEQELKEKWKMELIEKGISEDVAEEISNDYFRKLKGLDD